jgi:hypothetical protein
LQIPATRHWSLAEQTTKLPPTQAPAWHVSSCEQALLSLQGVSFAAGGLEHTPVAGLQTPETWHASRAEQTTGLAPTHTPAWHVSVWVQLLSSSQPVSSATGGSEQAPLARSHVPAAWHGSLAEQTTGFAPTQLPD